MINSIKGKKIGPYELLKLAQEQHKFEVKAPIDLDKIVNIFEINVSNDLHLDSDHFGKVGYIKIENGKPFIWINPLENSLETRKRFTLAHELGHLFLHINPEASKDVEYVDTEKTLNRTTTIWNTKEKEANDFAAKLLMPLDLIEKEGKKIIEEYGKQHNGEKISKEMFVSAMASKFFVSRTSMEFRLKNIGAIR